MNLTTQNTTEWPSSLDDGELAELDQYLRGHAREGDLQLDGVHGLLSAFNIGPMQILPDEWLPEILHAPFSDEDEGNRILALLAKLNDSIIAELEVDAYEPILGEIESEEGELYLSAAGWCEGFSRGIDLRAGLWEQRLAGDPQLMQLLGPVMALAVDEGILTAEADFEKLSEEEYDQCLGQIPGVLQQVGQYWQDHPVSEQGLEASLQRAGAEAEAANAPPRHRSGQSVH